MKNIVENIYNILEGYTFDISYPIDNFIMHCEIKVNNDIKDLVKEQINSLSSDDFYIEIDNKIVKIYKNLGF